MLNYTYSKKHNKLQIRKNRKGIKIFGGVVGLLTALTIFVQLYTMSIFATKGETVTALEQRKNELIKQNKVLSDEIAKSQNPTFLDQKSQELGYVDIDYKEVNYLVVE